MSDGVKSAFCKKGARGSREKCLVITSVYILIKGFGVGTKVNRYIKLRKRHPIFC